MLRIPPTEGACERAKDKGERGSAGRLLGWVGAICREVKAVFKRACASVESEGSFFVVFVLLMLLFFSPQ